MKNKKSNKVEYFGNAKVETKRRASLLRRAGICILFMLMVLSAVFAFGSLNSWRGNLADEESAAYAATANAANAQEWDRAINDYYATGEVQTVTLAGDWVADPKSTTSGAAYKRTEFGVTYKVEAGGPSEGYNYSGALWVPGDVEMILDLKGCKIDRNLDQAMNERGYVILVHGKLTIIDSVGGGMITGGWTSYYPANHSYVSEYCGGGINVAGGTLILEGGTICGNRSAAGGAGVTVTDGADFEMNGGSISNNEAVSGQHTWVSAGVWVSRGGFYLNDGTISNNVARPSAKSIEDGEYSHGVGGVMVAVYDAYPWSGTEFYMTGGKITGNQGWGTIIENAGGGGVGGVVSDTTRCESHFRGGEITNNVGNTAGGVHSHWSIYVSGKPVIKNNYVKDDENSPIQTPYDVDLYLGRGSNITYGYRDNAIIIDGQMQAGAHINVVKFPDNYTNEEGTYSTITSGYSSFNGAQDPSQYFHPSLPQYSSDAKLITLVEGTNEVTFENYLDIINWQDAVRHSNLNSGIQKTVKLHANITADDEGYFTMPKELCFNSNGLLYIDDTTGYLDGGDNRIFYAPRYTNVILDLNGHTIDRGLTKDWTTDKGLTEARENGYVFYIDGSTYLEIKDSSSTLLSNQGSITGGYNLNDSEGPGGIMNYGELVLSGGSIVNNVGTHGGGVCNSHGAIFTIKGGAIKNNYVFKNEAGDLGFGGGLYAWSCETYITGGEISGNHAESWGGGFFSDRDGDYDSAAAVKLSISGGSIVSNTADEMGGGLYFPVQNCYLGMSGDPIIEGNTVNGVPNDIYLPSTAIDRIDGMDNGFITIEGPFTGTGHKYGVYREINYAFTKHFSELNNPGVNPTEYFTAQKQDTYVSPELDDYGECQILSYRGYDNWYSAVVNSLNLGQQFTVKLTEDWNAVYNATADFGTSFFGDETVDTNTSNWAYPYIYGSILVPGGADIVLDLNGYTVDRKLADGGTGYFFGNVININDGQLTIMDSQLGGKVGKITGGWAHNYDYSYHGDYGYLPYGGGITLQGYYSKLFMEGGLITGNKSTCSYDGYALGVGGIGIFYPESTVVLTGGEISGNLGSFAGGVGMTHLTANMLQLGGSIRILDNYASKDSTDFGSGKPCDILNYAYTAGYENTAGTSVDQMLDTANYKFTICSEFTQVAKIGVSRPDTNIYTLKSTEGNVFTSGYSLYNAKDPDKVFFSSDPDLGEIRFYTTPDNAIEATFWIKDASINWNNAVEQGIPVDEEALTVTLYCDWKADENGRLGTGTGYTSTGGLYMPYSNIILDLNGFSIDRGFGSRSEAVADGAVIFMDGESRLEIVDYTNSGNSVITGGYNKDANAAGGIHMNTETCYLTLNGGTITGNKGSAGGVATYTDESGTVGCYFGMGGNALVTGNTDLKNNPLNINLRAQYVQVITLEYRLTNTEKSGVTKNGASDFTVGFNNFHGAHSEVPTDFFVADSSLRHVINTPGNEGALYTSDNYTNWSFAVKESQTLGDIRTVTLVSDWIANSQGLLAPNKSDNITMIDGGALYVNGARIILDLAGYTIDRKLTSPKEHGNVITIEWNGQLTLRDSVGGGKITGGNNLFPDDDSYAGGGVVNRGRFTMEGGIITGNRASGHPYSSGGVFNDSDRDAAGLFFMTGGEITGNFGTYTGGVNVYHGSQVYIGGSAKIGNNKMLNGEPADVRAIEDDFSCKINVSSTFSAGASIAVYYVSNNYATTYADNVFTSGYGTKNASLPPDEVFKASSPLKYKVVSYRATSGIEARIECIDNEQNWRQAVEWSDENTQRIFTMNADWVAYTSGTSTAFGSSSRSEAYLEGGALNVPEWANVVLDLNGYTLDRGLTTRKAKGLVINVYGRLEITDSSLSKNGTITGGYSSNTAGGIDCSSGKLTITGGTITGNKGEIGGGVYIHEVDGNAIPFAMGGSAVVTGNVDRYDKDADIVVTNPMQMIEIVSPLTEKAKGKTGFTRMGVGDFTIGFARLMPTEDPTDFFKSADPMYVFEYDNGEAALYTKSNQLNWQYAVQASQAGGGKQVIFKLLEDWEAIGGDFSPATNTTGYYFDPEASFPGMLHVPGDANIVLDLNGYKLDRNLKSASVLGCIMLVEGRLTLRDSSEFQTGMFTGGFNSYMDDADVSAQSSAIWMHGDAYVRIESGMIAGNHAIGNYSSAITIDEPGQIVEMVGGSITDNYGGARDSHLGAGGIDIHYDCTLKLGGTAKIYDNHHNFGGYSSDIEFEGYDLRVEIISALKKGANIGVAPYAEVDNYSTGGGVIFTKNFGAYHPTYGDNPERYFFGSWYQGHKVVGKSTDFGIEGALQCTENYTNWIYAVNASGPSHPITFQLTSDWIANDCSGDINSEYTTSFHPNDRSCFVNGAIYLPGDRWIILDLNGYIIDRGLSKLNAIENGYAIYIDGTLEVVDNSRLKNGTITGANNKDGGGGIIVDNGKLTVNGGIITENKGTVGAGVYVMDAGSIKLGGLTEIHDNVNAAGQPSNVYINNPDTLVGIVGAMSPRYTIGINRPSNGTVTKDFQKYMPGKDPLTVFASENANFNAIESGDGELFFLSPDNMTNWEYAVTQSLVTGKLQTVRLTKDWEAGYDASYGTSFGEGNGFAYGALYVPAGAQVELDLAGHKVDRAINAPSEFGLVFTVDGFFRVTDSSEAGTGLITGGRLLQGDHPYGITFYAGGVSVGYDAKFEMLGGNISGNWNSETGASAGGVFVCAGATFTLKDAAVISNQSAVAGVYVEPGAIFNIAGKAIVEDNKSGAGVANDVVFEDYYGVMSVTSALIEGAHIGVTKHVDNYDPASFGGNRITSDYGRYNTQPASKFFFSSLDDHIVIDYTYRGRTEAALFCVNNRTNWENAIWYSIRQNKEHEVKLYSDWTAERYGLDTSFAGENSYQDAYTSGALYVPAGVQITLDLNNFVLNRDLPAAADYGFVIYVDGTLKITDSSSAGAGQITGGWSKGTSMDDVIYASGIHVNVGGKLTITGGAITGNKGMGVCVWSETVFNLGGRAKVTGNAFEDSKNETNIFIEDEAQKINIVSEFDRNAKFGVTRSWGDSNFASGTLTKNYSKFNQSVNPTTYFTSDYDRYRIVDEGYFEDNSMEAAFISNDNLTNWAHAVKTSLNNGGKAAVCTLYSDWTAETDDYYVRSFGELSYLSCFYRGALYVPAGCHVILDLNGHTIDRALTSPVDNGSVIYVRGTLVIKDSSTEQTGTITGGYTNGYSSSYENGCAGGIAVYTGTLSIEGGTITENFATYGTGGVHLSSGSTFTMTGGKITGNEGMYVGGIYVIDSASITLGGSAYVLGNYIVDDQGDHVEVFNKQNEMLYDGSSNVFLDRYDVSVFVADSFKEGAKIGLGVDPYNIAPSGRLITSGWGAYNNAFDSTTVFSSDITSDFVVEDYFVDGVHEAMLSLRNSMVSWQNAVQMSLDQENTQTFVLYADWTAESDGAGNTYFGGGTGYYNGALFVPAGASIILDLKGYTIDRGLGDANSYVGDGFVIYVEGELTIIDSTAYVDRLGHIVQGKITGGNNYIDAGGIYVYGGALTVEGGLITNNRTTDYGGGIGLFFGTLALGGTAQFSDNFVGDDSQARREDISFDHIEYYWVKVYDFYKGNHYEYIPGVGGRWYYWELRSRIATAPEITITSQMIADSDESFNNIYVTRNLMGEFTVDWGKNNPTVKPESRFKASYSNDLWVSSIGTGSKREAILLANNNEDNWLYAVQNSLNYGTPQYFMLMDDWTATYVAGGTYDRSFGSNPTAYWNGALYVPEGANVVLDLNGYTLDRMHALGNDTRYADYNSTIIVDGTLQIIDSSENHKGIIKGGSYGIFLSGGNASVTLGGLVMPEEKLTGDETNVYGDYFGGTVTGNSLYGVYVCYGSFTATGGKVTGNTYADVCVSQEDPTSLNVGGDAYLYTPGRSSGVGVRLENPLSIINVVSTLSDNAKIGFWRQGVGQITDGWGLNNGNGKDPYAQIFESELPSIYSYGTEEINGYDELTVTSFDNAVNWQFVVDKSIKLGRQQEFTLYGCWIAAEDKTYGTSFGSGTAFRNGALYVPEGANVVLNLNGHKLDRHLTNAVQDGLVICVDGELQITNVIKNNPSGLTTTCCAQNNGVVTGGKNATGASGGAMYVGESGIVTLAGGSIAKNSNNSQSASAGAIFTDGIVRIQGGSIKENSGAYAGAVYVANAGTLEMLGGTIQSNNSTNGGGAVYSTGVVEITEGNITQNTGNIGGIYVASGAQVTMSGGSISENIGNSAGGVFVNNATDTIFKMDGGIIADNTAISAGGIYAAGVAEITGGEIKGNKATGTTFNNGGGAIYVAGTAQVTITGGEISGNIGENGIRVHAAGYLGVGGSARIINNIASNKTNVTGEDEVEANDYCDIYFTAKTRKLNVVSEFTSDARIGIYRLGAGLFTAGYGMYNNAHPNTVFVSNRSIFSISRTVDEDITNIEASIGIPVDPEPTELATPNVYNGNWQVIIKDINEDQVIIGALDTNLLRTGTADGFTTIEAYNAGSYTIEFSLKDGYCWKDGTTDEKIIHASLDQKVVKLVWSDEVHQNDEGEDVAKCVYDGETVHAPKVVVADSSLETNVITGPDTCEVIVSGGTIYASSGDGHIAKATALTNPNYKLGTDNIEYKFVVEKAVRRNLKVTSTQTVYNTPTAMEVSGNEENGTLHFFVEDEYSAIATIDEFTGELIVTQLGAKVKIRVVADETDNYKKTTVISDEIECVVGKIKATIAPTEITYGDSVVLKLEGTHNPTEIGKITFSLPIDDATTGQAALNALTGKFEALGVGVVKVLAHVDASDYNTETDIEGFITIVPRIITLDWGTSLTVPYNGLPQTLEAPAYEGVLPKDKASFRLEVVQGGYLGWDTTKAPATWTNVGQYEVGVILSNSNYALENEEDYYPIFEITKYTPDVKFKTLTAYYTIPFVPELEGVPEGASVEIKLTGNNLGNGGFTYNIDTGEYTPLKMGYMIFKATVGGTDVSEPIVVTGTFEIVQAEMPLEVSPTEIRYGDNATEITISYKDAKGNSIDVTDSVTIDLAEVYKEFAELTDIGGKPYITPKKVGTIKLKVNSPITETYVATEAELEIVIKPREVKVTWTTDPAGYIYNGKIQSPTADVVTDKIIEGDTVAISGYKTYQLNEDGELVEVDAINAGDYIAKAVMDNPNYAMDEECMIEFTISPRPVDLAWSNTTLTYNGEDQAPTAGVKNLVEGDSCNVEVLGGKDAGPNLTATAIGLDNDNYTLDGGFNINWNFKIDPLPVSVTWGETTFAYTGYQQAPEATAVGVLEGDECEVIVSGGQINVNPVGQPYTATATGLKNANYTLDGIVYSTTFNITPIDPTIELNKVECHYGDQFVLSLVGNDGLGAVKYTLGAGAENATLGAGNWFTAKNVGTVEILIEVDPSLNYKGAKGSVEITITALPIEVDWSNLTYTYDAKEHNATATLANPKFGDNVELKITGPKTNAGIYTASVIDILIGGESTNLYTIEGGEDVEQNFVINKRLLEVEWSNTEFTYDGTEHKPTATLSGVLDGESCTATVLGVKDAGMNIVAKIIWLSNSNYTVEGAENETAKFNIYQRLAKLEWSNTSLPYTGSDQLPTVKITNLVEGDKCEVTLTGAAASVGTHKAKAIGLSNPNYTLIFDDDETDPEKMTKIECDFEIGKAELKVKLSSLEVIFGSTLTLSLVNNPTGKEPVFTIVEEEAEEGVEVEIDPDAGHANITDNILTPSRVGKVTVHVHIDESDNYKAIDEDVIVTIKKLPVIITWEYGTFIYNQEVQTPTATVSNAIEEYPCTVEEVSGSSNAGDYLQAKVIKISDEVNYTLEGGKNVTTSYSIQPLPVESITWDEDRVYPFNGENQGPNVEISGILDNDECEARISGWKTNVGKYTAEVVGLSNSNYSLVGITNLKADYEITISKPDLKIVTTEVKIGTTEKIEVEGNVGNGAMTFEILEGDKYGELSGDKLYGKLLGTVKVKVKVEGTRNTDPAEAEGEIQIIKGRAPLKLVKNTVMYGSTLTLELDDDNGNLRLEDGSLMFGNVTFEVVKRFEDNAEIKDGNVLVTKHVGEIIVHVVTSDTEYFDKTDDYLEITITPRIVSVNWIEGTFIYNAKEQAPEAEISNLVNNDDCALVIVGAIDVGDHTAKIKGLTGLDRDNYTLERSENLEKDFHIDPYVLTLTWGDLEIEYNGKDHVPEAIVHPLGNDKCEVILVVEGEHKNVGFYTVKTNGVDNSNYVLDKEYETNYEIVPAELHPEFKPQQVVYGTTAAIELIGNLDNAPYTLTVDSFNSVGNGTLTKTENGDYEFTATRVGIVKIKVNIDATPNCKGYNDTIELLVVKADRKVSLLTTVGVYGENLVLELSGNDDDPGMVVFSVADNLLAEITGNTLTPKHAGNVTLTLVIGETNNYKSVRMTLQVTIKPRVISVSWKNSEFTYNGEVQTPEAEVDNLINGDSCEIEIGGGQINAGTYTTAYVVSVSNPDYTVEGSVSAFGHVFTIGKASIDVDLLTTRIHMGEETELQIRGNAGEAPVTFEITNTERGKATLKDGNIIVPEERGSVKVTVTVKESENYLGATKTRLVIIDKSRLKLTMENTTVEYGTDLDLEVEGNIEKQDITYTVVDMDGSAKVIGGSILHPVRAGKVKVIAHIAETDNYAATETPFEITITPILIELMWTNFEFTYDGENLFAPTAAVRSGLIGDDVCTVTVKGAQLNVGEYEAGTAYADDDCLSNKNYTLGDEPVYAPSFVIKRANAVISFETTAITIGVPTKILINGNIESGEMTFKLGKVTDEDLQDNLGEATLNGGIITGTKLGYVHVSVLVQPTANYSGGFAECDILVEKAEAKVSLDKTTLTYGDTHTFVVNNEDPEDGFSYTLELGTGGTGSATLVDGVLTAKGVGEVYVIIKTTGTETYKPTEKKIKITIVPIVVEVSWDDLEFEYDGTEKKPTATITNRLSEDILNVTVSGETYANDEAMSEITDLGNPNYTTEGSETASTKFVIKPRKVVLSWTEEEFTYNGEEQKPVATVSNKVETDTVSVSVKGQKDASDDCEAEAYGLSNSNYTLYDEDGNLVESAKYAFVIKPYAVYIEWGELDLEYTGQINVPEAKVLGALNGDVVNVTVEGVGADNGKCLHASASAYQATATGLDDTNYALKAPEQVVAAKSKVKAMSSGTPGALTTDYTIHPAKVTLSVESSTKQYNGEEQNPDIKLFLLNDNDDLDIDFIDGYKTDVGTYSVQLMLVGDSVTDYMIAEEDEKVEFKISPKTIDVLVTTKDKTAEYTGESVKLTDWYTLSISGLLEADKDKSLDEIFTINTLQLVPLFEQDGTQLTSAGARGEYTILADLVNVTGELSGSTNYKAKLVLDTASQGTLTISGGGGLQLAEDSEYEFIYEVVDGIFSYRKSYNEKSWVHGKDDLDFDRVVLGKIGLYTSIGAFLENIKSEQLDNITIYDQNGVQIIKNGQPVGGITEAQLYNSSYRSVGTGWKVLFGKDESAADVVYLSVLGDVNGDGMASALDISVIGNHITETTLLANVESRLAALIVNTGRISATDIAAVNKIMRGTNSLNFY